MISIINILFLLNYSFFSFNILKVKHAELFATKVYNGNLIPCHFIIKQNCTWTNPGLKCEYSRLRHDIFKYVKTT